MSATLKKLLMLSLALVLSFSLVAFVGCKEQLPKDEMDRVLAGAETANYDTVSFDVDMPMTVEAEGGSDPGTVIVDISGTGSMDIVNQAMQMTMDMGMNMMGESTDISAEVYILDGWMYTGVVVSGMGEQWAKSVMTEALWQEQDQVNQYTELLATAVEVKYKGTETVNGIECYVFEIEPDMDTLGALLTEETASMGAMNLSGLDLEQLYKELSVKEWLAKDGCRLQRAEVEIVMELRPEDVGATSDDFEKMTIGISMIMRFYAYGQPLNVVLPPEALAAEETPLEQ